MIKVQLTQRALEALGDLPPARCVDYDRHEFFCVHYGRLHGLNWRTKDGCSGDVCLGCYYADGGPASWSDLRWVQAVRRREIDFLRTAFAFDLLDGYLLDIGECVICGNRHPGFRSKCTL